MTSFNHNELCTIEQVTSRAASAIKQFANGSDRKALDNTLYILAEVRNAGQYLCDVNTPSEVRHEVIERLCSLFSED